MQKDHIYIYIYTLKYPVVHVKFGVYRNTKMIQHTLKMSLFKMLKLITIILKYLQSVNLSNIKTELGTLYKIQI